MIKLTINGLPVEGYEHESLLDCARRHGIDIPSLCHSEKIKAFGACGVCVVEAAGSPKLLRACATEIAPGMDIQTDTKRTLAARRTALELLMSDHEGDCLAPCQLACPGETDCQGYVGLIANGAFSEALQRVKDKIPLPASIGRVCPHPCEEACRRAHIEEPIAIANLKSFVADYDLSGDAFLPEILADTGKKVAILGGGPAGLSAAYFLRQKGHAVTVFDQMPHMGGMLRYGIPQYRLPKEVLQQEINLFARMGIALKNNVKIPETLTLESLRRDYDALLLAVGAWVSLPMGVKGEDQAGVLGGIDFLRDVIQGKPTPIGKTVAVCGGGNTAMDACRTAVRLGAETVYIVYRRTKAEMPADKLEITEAEEEGVIFRYLTNPAEILGEGGKVTAIRLQKMTLGEPDASGRRSPVPLDEFETLPVDSVIMALGQKPNLTGLEEVATGRGGTITAQESCFTTNLPGVFAAGDVTNKGPGIAIAAIAEAKKAAIAMDAYLNGAQLSDLPPVLSRREVQSAGDLPPVETAPRLPVSHVAPEIRRGNFEEIVTGYTAKDAMCEASRCLECGCMDYYECRLQDLATRYQIDPKSFSGKNHKRKTENTHPFVLRDEDKCILCGQCVRICHEVVGKTALGFVGRGFDTIVKPAMAQPLEETDCISCGQCVSVCPTGALIERQAMTKPVPLTETRTRTTCGLCSVGCQMDVCTHGSLVLRTLPVTKAESFGKGLLCRLGRFGFMEAYQHNRLKSPLVKTQSGMKESTWEDALAKAQAAAKNPGSKAVLLGDALTVEAIDKALAFAAAIGAEAYAVESAETNVPFWLEGEKGLLPGANSRYLQQKGLAPFTGTGAETVFAFGCPAPAAPFVCATSLYGEEAADILLPATAFLEEEGRLLGYTGAEGKLRQAISPVGGLTMEALLTRLL